MSNDAITTIKEIAEWSKSNFGNQEGDGLILGRIAPLLGMVEELGEIHDTQDYWETIDALGDYLVFLVDYAIRSGLSPEECVEIFSQPINESGTDVFVRGLRLLYVTMSSLCHCELKRVQGIRGFSDTSFYRETQKDLLVRAVALVGGLLNALNHDSSTLELLKFVWSRVRERNWKASPVKGTTEEIVEQCNGKVHPAEA